MEGSAIAELFHVRAELYAAARLPPRAYELYRTRALVTDVVARQCWLFVSEIAKLRESVGSTEEERDDGPPRVGILGGGHMGCAVAMALLANRFPADRIQISTRQPDRLPKCDALATPSHQAQFQTLARFYDNARLSRESDVLVLCVPPTQLKSVAIQIKHALAHSSCVVVSVLCGVATEALQKACGTKLVVRTQVPVRRLAALAVVASEDDDADARAENPSAGVSDALTTPDAAALEGDLRGVLGALARRLSASPRGETAAPLDSH